MMTIRTSGLQTLGDLYLRSSQWRGAEEMFIDADDRLTGRAALDASLSLAATYEELDSEAGDVVAFICRSSARHAAAWFAATMSGRIACNLHSRESPASIAQALTWLAPNIIVYHDEFAALVDEAVAASGIAVKRLRLDGESVSDASYDAVVAEGRKWDPTAHRVDPDAPVALLLSSGTTGAPKGVTHTHRSLLEGAKIGQLVFGPMTTHSCMLICMQPSFAAWSTTSLPMVMAKGRIVYRGRFDPRELLETCERERVTMVPTVPTMWRRVAAEDLSRYDLSSIEYVALSGEPPTQTDVDQVLKHFSPDISCPYMSSESFTAGAIVAHTKDIVGRGKIGSSGRPCPGADLKIIDPNGSFNDEMPAGEIGEIAISALSLAQGYWKAPELTATRFQDGWWRSGDLGRIDEDGYLWVQGRTDNVINTGGIKVPGEEVEAALLRHPQVQNCAVIGRPDPAFGQRIEAFLVVSGADLDRASLEHFLRTECGLAGFKIPKAFHFRDSLPVGPTGKLLRRALRD